MKRVNVLFVITAMGMGGSERLVYNLALKLDRSRFNPSVAWFLGDGVISEFKDLKIPLHHVGKTKRVDFTAMQRLHRIIRENKIDVVNAQHFMPAVYSYYGCKFKEKRALIFTAHSEWEIEEISWKWRIIGRYLLRRTDVSVGVTRGVSNLIQGAFKIDARQTVTIENGVDINAFAPKRNVGGLKRSLLGINGKERIIGIVANFKKVKNHRFLLQVFAELVKTFEDVKLVLVGRGFAGHADNTEEELWQFVNENHLTKKVVFLSNNPNIPDLLNAMDVFCLTSLKEGLPISLIEAMATGLPVVGTNVEGIRDVIVPHEDGLLIELGDVEGLKNAFIELLAKPDWSHKLGEAARRKAQEKYSLERCISEYEALLLSITPC